VRCWPPSSRRGASGAHARSGLFGAVVHRVQLAAFAVPASAFALFLYLTLYLQNHLGYSPLEAGLRWLLATLASFFAARSHGSAVTCPRPPDDEREPGGPGLGLLLIRDPQSVERTTLLGGFSSWERASVPQPGNRDVALSVVPKERAEWPLESTTPSVRSVLPSAPSGVRSSSAKCRQGVSHRGDPGASGDQPRHPVEAMSSGSP
jgi:hypothetical protein